MPGNNQPAPHVSLAASRNNTLPEAMQPDHRHISPGGRTRKSALDQKSEARFSQIDARLKAVAARIKGQDAPSPVAHSQLHHAEEVRRQVRRGLDRRRLKPRMPQRPRPNPIHLLARFEASVQQAEAACAQQAQTNH